MRVTLLLAVCCPDSTHHSSTAPSTPSFPNRMQTLCISTCMASCCPTYQATRSFLLLTKFVMCTSAQKDVYFLVTHSMRDATALDRQIAFHHGAKVSSKDCQSGHCPPACTRSAICFQSWAVHAIEPDQPISNLQAHMLAP